MGQNQRIMNKELGRTIKLFLLWCLLYVATAIIGLILGRVFKNIEFFNWTIVLGYILIIILFFGKGYVKLSFGRIEKPTIWPAVGVSVLIIVFALFHMSPLKIASTILFGIILGWLYWRTDSLILCIFIHVVNNSLCVVFSFIDLSIQPHSICLITFSVSLFLLALGLWWFWKKFSYAKPYY